MFFPAKSLRAWSAFVAVGCLGTFAHAAEHVTLRNGFDLFCDHREADGGKVKLYMDAAGASFLEVNATDIVADEQEAGCGCDGGERGVRTGWRA